MGGVGEYGGGVDDIAGTFKLGPESGRVVIKTGRAGLAARAGHDLTLEVTRWSATVTVPEAAGDTGDLTAGAQVNAELDFSSLAVREGTGGAKPLSDRDRREIEKTALGILGGRNDATARFESTRVTPTGSGGEVEGKLTFAGKTRPATLRVTRVGPLGFQASATVRQTDHGITPYSGFFGALKLRDEVEVVIEADLDKAARH